MAVAESQNNPVVTEACFMTDAATSNEEQLAMLLLILKEVRQGICLFQSEDQGMWANLIRERLGKEHVILHNIADDTKERDMVGAGDFRMWASQSEAGVVVIYNLQVLGLRYGDEEAIEKLNFMRDQLLSIGKLLVLGVSPYFKILLSRKARDLYSCIMYHFAFRELSEESSVAYAPVTSELWGDDNLEAARYREMKERIRGSGEKGDLSLYLSCMKSWNLIRTYISYQENEFVESLAEAADQQYLCKNMEPADLENIWILAATWLNLAKAERSVFWYEKTLCFVRELLGENHERYADALVEYARYYHAVSDYDKCEACYDHAVKIYEETGRKYCIRGCVALNRKAILCCGRAEFDGALAIYRDLLSYQIKRYGSQYYGNACLYNNIGRVYEEQGDLTGALQQYQKVLKLLHDEEGEEPRGDLIWAYQNLCNLYLHSGDADAAWNYIKKAGKVVEDIYGQNSTRLIKIYNSMSGVWEIRMRPDKVWEYLQKAERLIVQTRMEQSEDAADIYYNMGRFLYVQGIPYKAIPCYRAALLVREKIYGGRNKLTAYCYERLAQALYRISEDTEGEKYAAKARKVYVALFGSQDENVKRVDAYLKPGKRGRP